MPHKYVGKTCPYCKSEFKEDDVIVVCDTCAMPHHLSCWQDNAGCTTFGCTGMIKEMIGDMNRANSTSAPSGSKTGGSKGTAGLEVIYESDDLCFQKNSPIVTEKAELLIDNEKNEVYGRFSFKSISGRPIKAVLVDVACRDVWKNDVEGVQGFQYLDLKTSRGTAFGQNKNIKLPDDTTRSVSVTVKKVLFSDDTAIDCSPEVVTVPMPKTLKEHLGRADLADQYRRETTGSAKYVMTDTGEHWICACGAVNGSDEAKCHLCGCEKEALTALLSAPELEAKLKAFIEEKRAREEKAEADRKERIRLAAEAAEREREEKAYEIRKAERAKETKELKKKKRIKALAITFTSIIVVCLLLFLYVIPQIMYSKGQQRFEEGYYDDAYMYFSLVSWFKDGEEMANESRYQRACEYMDENIYTSAIYVFSEILDYRDAADLQSRCIFSLEKMLISQSYLNDHAYYQASDSISALEYVSDNDKRTFYNNLRSAIKDHADFEYWDDYMKKTYNSSVFCDLLLLCVQDAYDDELTNLQEIFKAMKNGDVHDAEWIRSNRAVILFLWDRFDFVKNMVMADDIISPFLEGEWETSNGDYYITFYKNSNGGTNCDYNLPWVAQPEGTKYYDIRNGIYVYTDEDMNELAEVFVFDIYDYDKMSVYCYKNGEPYTLHRTIVS